VTSNDYTNAKCPNCHGSHTAWSHTCPKYRIALKEIEAQKKHRQVELKANQQQNAQLKRVMTQSFAEITAKGFEKANDQHKSEILTCVQDSTQSLKTSFITEAKQLIQEQLASFKSEIQTMVSNMIEKFKTELANLTSEIKEEFKKEFLSVLDPKEGTLASSMETSLKELRTSSSSIMFNPTDGLVTQALQQVMEVALSTVPKKKGAGAYSAYGSKDTKPATRPNNKI